MCSRIQSLRSYTVINSWEITKERRIPNEILTLEEEALREPTMKASAKMPVRLRIHGISNVLYQQKSRGTLASQNFTNAPVSFLSTARMFIKKILQANYSRELHPNRNKHIMTVGDVLALNANAVNLLSSDGSVQGAIMVLLEALTALRQMRLVPIDTDQDNVQENYNLLSVSVKLDDYTSSYQDDNSFHLFGRAIFVKGCSQVFHLFGRAIFVKGCSQVLAPSDYLLNRISMVVTYNMGMAHHLLGTRNGNKQRRNYTRALTMYEVAYTLKKEYADNRDLAYLAVFNSMGHIYSHFWDKQSIHRCLEGMHSVLMSCPSNEDRAREEYDPFFMNVMMYYKKEAVTTPAA
jgi:hypothetical protein